LVSPQMSLPVWNHCKRNVHDHRGSHNNLKSPEINVFEHLFKGLRPRPQSLEQSFRYLVNVASIHSCQERSKHFVRKVETSPSQVDRLPHSDEHSFGRPSTGSYCKLQPLWKMCILEGFCHEITRKLLHPAGPAIMRLATQRNPNGIYYSLLL